MKRAAKPGRRAWRGLLAPVVGISMLLIALPPAGAEKALTRMPVAELGSFERPQGIAVDQANGDIYVIDVKANTISRYDSNLQAKPFAALGTAVLDGIGTGACPTAPADCDETPEQGFSLAGAGRAQVAVDRSGSPLTDGNIYVTDVLHRKLDVFSAAGQYLGRLAAAGPEEFGQICGVAVEPDGTLDVSDPDRDAIYRFEPSANPPLSEDSLGWFEVSRPCGIAAGAQAAAGSLFAASPTGPVSRLDALGTERYEVGPSSARGPAVDPATGNLLLASGGRAYEYDVAGEDEATLLFSFGAERFGSAGGIAVDGGSGRAYISDTAGGKVHVFGPASAAEAPEAQLAPYMPISGTAIRLSGFVTPNGTETTYRFEYGSSDCAVAACDAVPVDGEPGVGSGVEAVSVSQEVSGLEPGATYSYRLIASSPGGTGVSASGTFSTLRAPSDKACPNEARRQLQGAEYLPDCRAYERVSAFDPSTRRGADVLVDSRRSRSAAGGDALQFSSTIAAGDAESLPFSTEYLASRDRELGWRAHGITPPQRSLTLIELILGLRPGYVGQFSPDLSKAAFLSNSLLSKDGRNVEGLVNLYLRDDLRLADGGDYRLLSDAVAPLEGAPQGAPAFAGASADFGQVLFESSRDLTSDAAGLDAGPRLYRWGDGALRLVGVLPAAEGGGPTVAQAGRGAGRSRFTPHVISTDGARVAFTAPPFASSGTAGNLYLREDRGGADPSSAASFKVNVSERAVADPNGTQAATFWDASRDLSQVFFTTGEALTDDASSEYPDLPKLYRYDVGAPAGERLTLLSVDRNAADGSTDRADGVIGASENGSYLYFVGSNQLVPGASTATGPRIFVWHGGVVREVAPINDGTETRSILGSDSWQGAAKWARVTPDGAHLVFITEGSDASGGFDHGEGCPENTSPRCLEVYMYDASTWPGRLQCASCSRDGSSPRRDSNYNARATGALAVGSSYLNRAVSSDGRYVYFATGVPLSPRDSNGGQDVYRFDATSGSVRMISSGRPGVESSFLDASASGGDIFIATRDPLLAGDGDESIDVYDARVGGGFDEAASSAQPCASERDCRPPFPPLPLAHLPASASILNSSQARKRQRCQRRHLRRRRHGHVRKRRSARRSRRRSPKRAARRRGCGSRGPMRAARRGKGRRGSGRSGSRRDG